ncbi:MAG: RNA polymerase sigma factor [Caulobacteraceae bacterium]
MISAATEAVSDLTAAYLAASDDLKRLFALRLRSAAAAEDLIQDLYVKVAAWPPGAEIGNPDALLYRMATNLMLDRIRTERRTSARDAAWVDVNATLVGSEFVDEQASAERAIAGRQRAQQLSAAIQTLPPQTRQAFTLHKLDGLTHAEAARRLGVSQKTVEKQVSAALRKLAAALGETR